MIDLDEWVCIEDGEDDYVIERFEVRVKGKKPLVLNNPSMEKVLFVTQQYLNSPLETTKEVLRRSILQTSDPFTLNEYWKLRHFLENSATSD